MTFWLAIVVVGILLRQVDRFWHAHRRPRSASLARIMELQRCRANNFTPAMLLVGQWVQIVGCWGVAAAGGPAVALLAAAAVAVQLRHLQEVSHFAVHGVLARSARLGNLLAEILVHHPLGFVAVPVRRKRHVRDHHPNATVTGTDPNLADLQHAGMRPGVGPLRFAIALIHPLTPAGALGTVASLALALRPLPRSTGTRATAVLAVAAGAYLTGGWPVLLFGWVVPRLLLYPQLAWMSLLVEHTWFDPTALTGSPAVVESGRCLRLYPSNRVLAAFAASTWLPYGDLYHYAHSAHPAVRWSYLPALERHLGRPRFTPAGLLFTGTAVISRHRRALTTPTERTPTVAPASARG
ncbi:fatty acid desaturase [Streptomyces sp. 846.5]|nr:fatty acid desaturase [Streptomyces sp. 846.5]TDT94168.1 fatty acid desaturase [Streptomyces sp. 846.5]